MNARSRHLGTISASVGAVVVLALLAAVPSAIAKSEHPRGPHRHGHTARASGLKRVRPLRVGFSAGADGALASGSTITQRRWVPKAKLVGAQMVRLEVFWAREAPADPPSGFLPSDPSSPGYNWSKLDEQVRELAAAHFQILITVRYAPRWAEGNNMPGWAPAGTWRPSASQFGDFARAIATRYDGHFRDPLNHTKYLPKVSYWQGWNEPNLVAYLTPQWNRARNHRFTPASPGIYRNLENAFYKSVKRVSKHNFVVAAGTAPYGDEPGGRRMAPVYFDRALFCLDRSLKRNRGCKHTTYLDAIDNHPYGIGGPLWHALNTDDVAVPDVYKLALVLHAAERVGTVLPKGSKGIWTTEIAWDTNPPDPNGIATKLAARWLEQALYVLWRQGVGTVLWWQLVDSPPIPNYASTYQGGVYLLNGKAKPSAAAYRFPFVGIHRTRTIVKMWGRAPATGTMLVQRHRGGHWRTVARGRVRSHEVFELSIAMRGKGQLRAKVGPTTSVPWPVSR